MTAKMNRRDFITLLGGAAAAWPLAARAQATKVARIGYLHLAPASARSSQVEALRAGLRNLGYVEGKSIVIEFRWAESVEQLRDLAAELVRMNPPLRRWSSRPGRRPGRSPSCSTPMPIPSASGTWRTSRDPVEMPRGCRPFAPILRPRSWNC